MEIIFRTYEATDHLQVMQLHKEALLHANAYTGEGPWDDDLLDIENHYLNNKGWFVVGELNNTIITMGAFRKINNEIAEIKRMRTQPGMQGKGIGAKVLQLVLGKIKEAGYNEVILETSDRQPAAQKIYINAGFVSYESENIRGLNCTWYRKVLK
jgi:GNAT superfamily N-acetyltransferase